MRPFSKTYRGNVIQTIQVTLEDAMLVKIDRIVRELSLTRTAVIQQSLEAGLREQEILAQERRHAEGYARHPVEPGEFDGLDAIRVWGSTLIPDGTPDVK